MWVRGAADVSKALALGAKVCVCGEVVGVKG